VVLVTERARGLMEGPDSTGKKGVPQRKLVGSASLFLKTKKRSGRLLREGCTRAKDEKRRYRLPWVSSVWKRERRKEETEFKTEVCAIGC